VHQTKYMEHHHIHRRLARHVDGTNRVRVIEDAVVTDKGII
jgi:hypothetical protein